MNSTTMAWLQNLESGRFPEYSGNYFYDGTNYSALAVLVETVLGPPKNTSYSAQLAWEEIITYTKLEEWSGFPSEYLRKTFGRATHKEAANEIKSRSIQPGLPDAHDTGFSGVRA